MRTPTFTIVVSTVLILSSTSIAGQPERVGDLVWHQKISDTEGGFTGILDNGDSFGGGVTSLGDLDKDGVDDLAVGSHMDGDGGDRRGSVWILFMNQNASVKSYQKISDTQGGFTGTLDNIDWFGSSVAGLGDLDGDTVPDLAVGANLDDDGGSQKGAIWILFLNTNGTVKSHQKISDYSGSFYGSMGAQGKFGTSIANLGDLDNDGIIDLAVGAYHDNNNYGSVWILFMNMNGTVKSYSKITAYTGGFSGSLGYLGQFGWATCGLGDHDGDGVEDMAVGARRFCDGGGPPCNVGAVWVLHLNSNGTVKDQQKIAGATGGFTGQLDSYEFFGSAVASVGDLDGDGIGDLAVGATQDDDGSTDVNANFGAVWLLFLNLDGTVKAHNKISRTSGNFDGLLDEDDYFGSSLANLGDFDLDGVVDLAAGAMYDDDGGSSRGAIWCLFLDNSLAVGLPEAPAGQLGVKYGVDLQLQGGTPPYSLKLQKGSLPKGLSLAGDGMLSGKPKQKGMFDFTVKLTDNTGTVAKKKYSLKVYKALQLTTSSLDQASHGEKYKFTLAAKQGEKPYGWQVISGDLPNGVELNETKGRLSGKPLETGKFDVTIQVTDAQGATDQADYTLKVKKTLKVSTKSLPDGKKNKGYAEKVKAKGGIAPYSWTVSAGVLPDGLNLNPSTGLIEGTPTKKGKTEFTVRVTDDTSNTHKKKLTIKVK